MQTEPMSRRFYYLGLELADLDPRLTPEQVRDAYCGLYPEITTATIEGPEVIDGALKFTLTRALGTKRMTRKEAILELETLARDPNRQRLEEKFKRCPEARKVSELLGVAVLGRKSDSRRIRREDSLPVPPSLVHPG